AAPIQCDHVPQNFFSYQRLTTRHRHTFPTRRSSDLSSPRLIPGMTAIKLPKNANSSVRCPPYSKRLNTSRPSRSVPRRCSLSGGDRKSTRLNSSHVKISYAVFCLKKKKNISIC